MERGLLYFRLTPIATKFCVAEEFRDVPTCDIERIGLFKEKAARGRLSIQS
jgi:hypothetical protein